MAIARLTLAGRNLLNLNLSGPNAAMVSERTNFFWAIVRFFITLHKLLLVGLYEFYVQNFAFVMPRVSSGSNPLVVIASTAARSQWKRNTRTMRTFWKVSLCGSGLLIPVSVWFLQIERIANNPIAKLYAFAAFAFAFMGFVSSIIFLIDRPKLLADRKRTKWLWACQYPSEVASVRFWTCLAFPPCCCIWSLALCTALACFIKFTPDEQVLDISKVEMTIYKISAVALAVIVSFACGQLLSVLRFFRGL